MKAVINFLIFVLCVNNCFAIHSVNSARGKRNINPALWMENQIWGPILEQRALDNCRQREIRVMQIPISEHADLVHDRGDLETEKAGHNNKGENVDKPLTNTNHPSSQISDTDLYLLSAIEKLVLKVDFMEKRLRMVEEMLFYVMAGNRMEPESCSKNFTRIGPNCYFFANIADREYDWKVASKSCKKLGAVLAEMESIEENQDIINYIHSHEHLRGKDFWIGGLNPGLLWIWSYSARPIIAQGFQIKDNSSGVIQGDGRCLKIAFTPGSQTYGYKGTDCSLRYSFICESIQSTSNNGLQRIGTNRKILNER